MTSTFASGIGTFFLFGTFTNPLAGRVVPAMRSPFLVHESSLTSVFKFHQFLPSFFKTIEFCIPFSRKCVPVLTLGHPEGCIEKLGCPFFLSFSSLLLSSPPLLIMNSEKTSFWQFGCHKQLLLVATFSASLAGYFEKTRKSMCHAFTVFSHGGNKITVSLSRFCFLVQEESSFQCQVPPIIGKTTFALEPLLGRFFDTAHCPLDETIRLRMVRRVRIVQPFKVFARFYERV